MKYTVGMATWYGEQWHEDTTTTTELMSESEVLVEGHKLASMGAFPLYRDENEVPMIEFQGRLEPAFAEMVAPRKKVALIERAA